MFVGNLPFDVEEEEIWDYFSQCGDVLGACPYACAYVGAWVFVATGKKEEMMDTVCVLDTSVVKFD